MELRHVYGRTYAAVGATALMPVYKLTDTDIVLMDTGYAKLDRSALTNLIEDNGFRLRGILCSHAHFDHTGNVRYLQQRYGCQAAAQIIEAGISVNPDAYRANYVALTYGKSHEYFLEECFLADVIIPADADHVDFCGARFGILQLPGHSAGHIGIVTPDNVAYVGDCLIDEGQIEGAKLPTSMFIARDLESKESLRTAWRTACPLTSGSIPSAKKKTSGPTMSSSSAWWSGILPTLWTGWQTRAALRCGGNSAPSTISAGMRKANDCIGGRKPAIIGGHPCKYNEKLRY